ncbi:MAG: thioredoxin domain-containing protein [bacterium]|nr:thioredoxin domain-containing protein [bacterium]
MEIKLQKKQFYILLGSIIFLGAGIVFVSNKKTAPSVRPYAGVSGADLPTVVGEPTLDTETKIPFVEFANYKEYTPELLASAKTSGNATILFFYADWCSSCKAQEPMHTTFFKHALDEKLPLTGIRIDIDDHKDIAREYGINYQHSYVLLDKTGAPVSKFFGTHTSEQLEKAVSVVL